MRKQFRIDSRKKIALLIGQVATDAVMAIDSYVYKDSVEFIKDTIKLFKAYPDYHLIVRLHPKESFGANQIKRPYNNITFQRLKELNLHKTENVSIVHSMQSNTYSLMDISDFAIVINSQAGLEMLSRHKPVIVLGDAFYSKKGFTFDVNYKETYPILLKKVIEKPELSQRQKMDIDKFLYHMIFKYLFPIDLIALKSHEKRLLEMFG